MKKILVAELTNCDPPVLLGSWESWASMARALAEANNRTHAFEAPINVHVVPLGGLISGINSHVAILTFNPFGQVQPQFLHGHSEKTVSP